MIIGALTRWRLASRVLASPPRFPGCPMRLVPKLPGSQAPAWEPRKRPRRFRHQTRADFSRFAGSAAPHPLAAVRRSFPLQCVQSRRKERILGDFSTVAGQSRKREIREDDEAALRQTRAPATCFHSRFRAFAIRSPMPQAREPDIGPCRFWPLGQFARQLEHRPEAGSMAKVYNPSYSFPSSSLGTRRHCWL